MPKAKWTTDPRATSMTVAADGSFIAVVPLLDDKVKQGDLVVEMTADRALTFTWRAEPGADGITDFQAWSTQ